MSKKKAIAQSATQLAVSPNGEHEFDFNLVAKNASFSDSKGLTREKAMLQRSKLITSVVNTYRSHFSSIYGRKDVLPKDIFEKIEQAVDLVIAEAMSAVHNCNVISMRRAFHYQKSSMSVTERVTVVGENILTLREQKLGITLYIGQAEKRLRELQAKPTPNHDAEKKLNERLMNLGITKSFIETELQKLEEVQAAEQAKG
jgi:hypothetical protein